jgi:hypothetical protein
MDGWMNVVGREVLDRESYMCFMDGSQCFFLIKKIATSYLIIIFQCLTSEGFSN